MTQGKTHSYPLTILEKHLDTFGHVNHAVYLEIFEEARWDLITQNGYGLDTIQKTGHGIVILELNLRFKKELKLRQQVTIETNLVSCQKKISVVAQTIQDKNKEIYCFAEFTLGLFDLNTRKLIPATPEWLKGIGGI